jgi:5,10-methylenetetrahydromethanopterin reductase
MGLGPQPFARLREYVDVVQALLCGETATWHAEGTNHEVRFLHPDLGFVNVQDPVPLHISAFGPRGRALTADRADGWITFSGSAERAAADVAQIDESARSAGRDPASLAKTAFMLGCVLAEDEDPGGARAIAQAGPLAAVGWHGMMERMDAAGIEPEPGTPAAGYRELYQSYGPPGKRYLRVHTGHLLFVRDDERPFVTGEMIRRQTFTGTAAELRDHARAFAAAGYTQLVVQLIPGHEDAIEDWARVFDLA